MVGGGIPLLFTDQLPINIYRQFVTFSQKNPLFPANFSGRFLPPPPHPQIHTLPPTTPADADAVPLA